MYQILKRILFLLDAEPAHKVALESLRLLRALGLIDLFAPKTEGHSKELLGLKFPNVLGLAAGFDKNADYLEILGELGFGHIEVGTVTPRAQPGNPKPRLFRLLEDRAVINRMGFNNRGLTELVRNIEKQCFSGILGVNIGKNFDTPLESAEADYLTCFQAVYEFADYITVNVSSPNTAGLRSLQTKESLTRIIAPLKEAGVNLATVHGKNVPLLVKFAPDLEQEDLEVIAEVLVSEKVDGLIATNTTITREGLKSPLASQQGGLSGAPLTLKARSKVQEFRKLLGQDFPIIGVGGIMSGADAQAMLDAGADLLQIYTGFVYEGPKLIEDILSL